MTNLSRLDVRVGWIEACLRYAGSFTAREKDRYKALLNVGDGTVSADMRRMVDVAPRGTLHIHAGRIAIRTPLPLEPIMPLPDLRDWLAAFTGDAYLRVPDPRDRMPSADVLQEIYRAIVAGHPVRLRYVSRSSGTRFRTISPHTIVDVTGRLHVRAFSHDRNEFRDFVLTRMSDIQCAEGVGYVSKATDLMWTDHVTLEMRTAPNEDADLTRIDYRLDESGTRRFHGVRLAVAPYLVDQAGAFRSPVSVVRR